MTTDSVAVLLAIAFLVLGMLKIAFYSKNDPQPEEWEQQERPHIEPNPKTNGKAKRKKKPTGKNSNRPRGNS